jgi:lysozyme family protein
MDNAFNIFVEKLIKIEGGYVNDPNDSGGETNYGITVAVARQYGYGGDMRKLPLSFAKQIYYEQYWRKLRLHEISGIAPCIAGKLADIAVNMGVARAGEFYQRVLNVLNREGKLYFDIKVDGRVGPQTVLAFQSFHKARGTEGLTVFMRALNCLQGHFYISLAERRQKDESFVYGWLLNRIN